MKKLRITMIRKNWRRYLFYGSLFIVTGLVITVSLLKCSPEAIYDYNPKRDYHNIISNLKVDWYWLVEEGLQFDPHHMLTTRSPNKDPIFRGKLHIKVLLERGKFGGFITYYKKGYHEGWIQFLSITRGFRGKGYGKKLINCAVKNLFNMGCTEVKLVTRVNNIWAQRIYTALKFKEYKRDAKFVEYVIKKPY